MVFYWHSDLISHTEKHKQHTQGPADWQTNINIYLHYLLSAHSNILYYIKWLYFPQCLFSLENCLLVKVIYLLIRCYKTRFFHWNTRKTDRNGVNKQNAHRHTPNTQRKIILEKVSMKISDTTPLPLFLKQPHLFYQPLHFYGKNLTSPLFFGGGGEGFWKINPPLLPLYKGRRFHLCFSFFKLRK